MVNRLELKTNQMVSTIRDMETGSVSAAVWFDCFRRVTVIIG